MEGGMGMPYKNLQGHLEKRKDKMNNGREKFYHE
jgi:hypothetical protein